VRWVRSNGRTLEVREVSEPDMRLRATSAPLPIFDQVMSDDEARAVLRDLLAAGHYVREPLTK
jgi:hypothetical protein